MKLSGDHGPQFVGYEVPPFWQVLACYFAFGVGVGAVIFVLMLLFRTV